MDLFELRDYLIDIVTRYLHLNSLLDHLFWCANLPDSRTGSVEWEESANSHRRERAMRIVTNLASSL
jgi:hypothetical protein